MSTKNLKILPKSLPKLIKVPNVLGECYDIEGHKCHYFDTMGFDVCPDCTNSIYIEDPKPEPNSENKKPELIKVPAGAGFDCCHSEKGKVCHYHKGRGCEMQKVGNKECCDEWIVYLEKPISQKHPETSSHITLSLILSLLLFNNKTLINSKSIKTRLGIFMWFEIITMAYAIIYVLFKWYSR